MYFVYILASKAGVLYIGVTNDLMRRVKEHRKGLTAGFTRRYRVHRLVYFETFDDPGSAIERESRLKGWTRARKLALVQESNRELKDLYPGLVRGE